MKNERDTMLRIEKGNASLTVDKEGVVRITAPVITVGDRVDRTEVRR